MKKKMELGYMDSCTSNEMKQLTPQVLHHLATSPQVKKTMDAIRQANDDEQKSPQYKDYKRNRNKYLTVRDIWNKALE